MPQNIRNALQAMSNTAASNISAPVDGIAWLLRKAGIPVPTNALMSSEWMRERGLTAPVEQGAGQVVGDTLGLLAPAAVAAAAPQIARGLLAVERNALAPREAGMVGAERGAIVYHGSPHKFDAFDSSKIGTGEGAQAYGHGLYLAENPSVAKGYQIGGHVNPAVTIDGEAPVNWALSRRDEYKAMPKNMQLALRVLADHKDIGMARQSAQMEGQTGVVAALDELVSSGRVKKGDPGNLYKVDLPDEKIARMLDWDKPLSQQAPEARNALQRLIKGNAALTEATPGIWTVVNGPNASPISFFDKTQADEYVASLNRGASAMPTDTASAYLLAASRSSAQEASNALRAAGIPGIRYLDGGSRSAGAGTSNYVVFPGEENALRILERNGQALGR